MIETALFNRLTVAAARGIVDEVRAAPATWPAVARAGNLGPGEVETLREAIAA